MARKRPDADVAKVVATLEGYRSEHPTALINVYRYNSASIRIRIIDEAFEGKNLVERDRMVRRYLRRLPESASWQVTMVLLLTPEERSDPWQVVNGEFERPSRSSL